MINFHVNHPLYHEYLARVRESFGAAMFEVVDDDMTNSIVFACKGDLLTIRRRRGCAGALSRMRGVS